MVDYFAGVYEMTTKDTIIQGPTDVTVVVSRIVKPGNERKFDRWARRMVTAATEFKGNTGVTMLMPEPGKRGLYHLVFRFKDQAAVDAWENSEIRRALTEEADSFSERFRQASTGMETWFTVPELPYMAAPPQWKMFLVTTLAVFIVSCCVIPLVKWLLNGFTLDIPNLGLFFLDNIITSTIIVAILTWVMMPFLSNKVFSKWLYK